MSTSPYKKLKTANQSWVGYISIAKLAPNKCHKMIFMNETNHPQYGKGQLATIQCPDGKRFRVQLPGKYLAQLSPEDITTFNSDMINNKNPFLIYREKMLDNSFRIDIVEASAGEDYFKSGMDFPELNDSVEEIGNETVAEELGNNETVAEIVNNETVSE